MKKIISYLGIVLCLCICIVGFAGCNKTPKQEYTKIELSLDNYSNYLAFNFYFTDQQAILDEDGRYILYCTGHIETVKSVNCNFDNVNIAFNSPNFPNYFTHPGGLGTNVSYEGYSHTSFGLTSSITNAKILYPPASLNYISVLSISGYVIIPN
ncbi:MAG TPA: hypothetical protein PKV66_02215 [Candidatus Pelethenecus sp.]|nr:hypothetical protein [Candidatus Pelethenecus sp.]